VTMQLLLWYSCSGVSFSLIVYTEPPISFLVLVHLFALIQEHTPLLVRHQEASDGNERYRKVLDGIEWCQKFLHLSRLVLVSVFDHCSVEKHTASPSQKGVVDPAI
jgi:hypothetical protein